MKIEPAKNTSVERKESKNVFKTDVSAFDTSNAAKNAHSVPAPPSTGAFAKILEETRKQNGKENSPAAKTDSAEPDATASKADKDEKTNRQTTQKKVLEERSGGDGNGGGGAGQNGDENQ